MCVCVFSCVCKDRVCCDAAISAEIDLKIFMALLKLGVESNHRSDSRKIKEHYKHSCTGIRASFSLFICELISPREGSPVQ